MISGFVQKLDTMVLFIFCIHIYIYLDYIIGYHVALSLKIHGFKSVFFIFSPWVLWPYRCVFRPPVLGAGTLLARLLNTWDGTNTYNYRRDMMKLPCCNHVLRKSKVWTFRTAFSPWNIATVDFSDSPNFNGHTNPICLMDAMSYPICLMAN